MHYFLKHCKLIEEAAALKRVCDHAAPGEDSPTVKLLIVLMESMNRVECKSAEEVTQHEPCKRPRIE